MSKHSGAALAGWGVTGGTGPAAQQNVAEMLASPAAGGRWVIDPAGSRAEFAVKQFWGAATVRGSLGPLSGEASVAADGTMCATLTIDAASLNTNNRVRDAHLRSADFFDVRHHPEVRVTVTAATPAGPAQLDCRGIIAAAGRAQPVEFTAYVRDVTPDAVVIEAELLVDRTGFAMTWSPLGAASATARGLVVARFIRPHDASGPAARRAPAARQRPQRTAEPGPAPWIQALRQSHDTLKALVEQLDAGQLDQQSYAPDWSIAQVLSHLGSQAEIFELFLDAALSGAKAPGPEAYGPIWEIWNAKSAQAQAAESLAADAALLGRIESFDDAHLRLPLLGMDLDLAGLVRKRLSEHTQHSWDIAVTLNPAVTLPPAATGLLVDNLVQLVGRAAKPDGRNRCWHVRTTEPERYFTLETSESATLTPSEREPGPADLVLPAEAFIRLVCGQLDQDHTPAVEGTANLDELRAVFPGF